MCFSYKFYILSLSILTCTCSLIGMDSQTPTLPSESAQTTPTVADLQPMRVLRCPHCYDVFFLPIQLSEHLYEDHPEKIPVAYHRQTPHTPTQSPQRIANKRRTRRAPKRAIPKPLIVKTKPKRAPQPKRIGPKNQCKDCGKQFRSDYFLLVHRRQHTGEKPPACRICNKEFSYRANRDRHERDVHRQ